MSIPSLRKGGKEGGREREREKETWGRGGGWREEWK